MAFLITPGTYTARAVESGLGKTQGGKPQVAIRFQITQDGDWKGQYLTWYGSFTDKAREITFKALDSAGWGGESLRDLSGIGSCECAIVVEHEADREGLNRARIRWVNRIGGLSVKDQMSGSEVDDLDRQLRGDMLAWKQKKPRQQKRAEENDDSFEFGANSGGDGF
jgi:hypothetical protein